MAKQKDAQDKDITPVSLADMLGQGNFFEAQGKEYVIKPLKIKKVDEFLRDQISIGAQIFNFSSPDAKEKLEKWIPQIIFKNNDDETGLTLQDLMDDDWDLDDLRRLWQKLLGLSG